jgi:hypothetical protein
MTEQAQGNARWEGGWGREKFGRYDFEIAFLTDVFTAL